MMAAYRVLIFTLALYLFGLCSVPFVTTSNISEKSSKDKLRKTREDGNPNFSEHSPCATDVGCYNVWMVEPFCGKGEFQEGELISLKLHVSPCQDNGTDEVSIQWWISKQGKQLALPDCRGKEVCHVPEKYVEPEKELSITTKIFVGDAEKKINTTLKPSGMKNYQKAEQNDGADLHNENKDKSFKAEILEDKSNFYQAKRVQDQISNLNVVALSSMINISENLENIQKPKAIPNVPNIELIPPPPLIQRYKYPLKQNKNVRFKLKTRIRNPSRKGKQKHHSVEKSKAKVKEVTTESPETVFHAAVYDKENGQDLATKRLSNSSVSAPHVTSNPLDSPPHKSASTSSFLSAFNEFFRNLASSLVQITRGDNSTKAQQSETPAKIFSPEIDDGTNSTSEGTNGEESNLLNFGQIEDTVDSLHHIHDETRGPLAKRKFYGKSKVDGKHEHEKLSSKGLAPGKKTEKSFHQNGKKKKTVDMIFEQPFLRLSDFIMGSFENGEDKPLKGSLPDKENGEKKYVKSERNPKLDAIHIEVNNRQDMESKDEKKIEKSDVASTGKSGKSEDAMVDRIETDLLANLKEKEIEKHVEKKIEKDEKRKQRKRMNESSGKEDGKSSGKGMPVDGAGNKQKNETNSTSAISVDSGVASATQVQLKRKSPTKIRNFSSKISWFSPEQVLKQTGTLTKHPAKQRTKFNRRTLDFLKKTLKTIMPRRKISPASLRVPFRLHMSHDSPHKFNRNALEKNEDVYFYKKIDNDIASLIEALGKKREPVNIDRDLKMALASVEGNIYRTLAKGTTFSAAKWMGWSAWGPCSRSCDLGYMTQTRVCITHQSKSKCVGPSVRLKTCKIRSCSSKTDFWSEWEAWSPCSVTCASGTQMRRRTCQKKNNGRARAVCEGWSMDRRICIHSSCTGGSGVILDRIKVDKTVALICDKTNNDDNYLVKWKIPSGFHVTPKTKSKRFKVSDKYLVIKHIKDSDRGLYRCTIYDRVSVSTDCRFNPCLHGGQCVMKYDINDESPPAYFCQCPHGYKGEICADDDSLKGIHIAGIVLVIFLLGVVKVLMVYLCYRFRKSILLKKELEKDRFRRIKEKIQNQLFPPDPEKPDLEMNEVVKKEDGVDGDEKVDPLLQAMREEDMDKVQQHLSLKGLQGNPKLVDKILEICDEEKLAPSFQLEYQDKVVCGAGGADSSNVNTSRMKSVKFHSHKADGKQDEFYQSSYTTSNPASSCTLASTNPNSIDAAGKPLAFFKQTGNTIHCHKHKCGMVMLEENYTLDKDMTCKPCEHAMIPVDAAQHTFDECCEEDHGRIRDVINGFVVGFTAGADNDSSKDEDMSGIEEESEFDMLNTVDPFVLSETHAVSTPIKGHRPTSPVTVTRKLAASKGFDQPEASTSFNLTVENFLPPMPDIDANTLFDDSKSLVFQSLEGSMNQRDQSSSLEQFIKQSTSLALSDGNYTFSPIEVEPNNGCSEEFTVDTSEAGSPFAFRSWSDREENFNASAYGMRQLMPIIEEPSEGTSEEEVVQDLVESQIYQSTCESLVDVSSAQEAGEETEHTPYLSMIDSQSDCCVNTDHDHKDALETISEYADDHETVWESFYQKK